MAAGWHLFLIGPRGSGKTVVGRCLAMLLQRPFLDLDQWIADQTGCTIAEIFQQQGEEVFRDWETVGLQRLVLEQVPPSVISLGGGACQRPENRRWIREIGRCVWLQAPPQVLLDRIRGDQSSCQQRPPLTDRDQLAELEYLVRERQTGYEHCADYAINTAGELPLTIANQIAAWWQTVDNE